MKVHVLGLGQLLNKLLLSLLCAHQSPRHRDRVREQTVLNVPSRHSSAGAMGMQVGEETFSAVQKPHHQPPQELSVFWREKGVRSTFVPLVWGLLPQQDGVTRTSPGRWKTGTDRQGWALSCQVSAAAAMGAPSHQPPSLATLKQAWVMLPQSKVNKHGRVWEMQNCTHEMGLIPFFKNSKTADFPCFWWSCVSCLVQSGSGCKWYF